MRDLAEPKRATEPLRDELEKLQGEHSELKARLAKLEARFVVSDGPPASGKAAPKTQAKKTKGSKLKPGRKA